MLASPKRIEIHDVVRWVAQHPHWKYIVTWCHLSVSPRAGRGPVSSNMFSKKCVNMHGDGVKQFEMKWSYKKCWLSSGRFCTVTIFLIGSNQQHQIVSTPKSWTAQDWQLEAASRHSRGNNWHTGKQTKGTKLIDSLNLNVSSSFFAVKLFASLRNPPRTLWYFQFPSEMCALSSPEHS